MILIEFDLTVHQSVVPLLINGFKDWPITQSEKLIQLVSSRTGSAMGSTIDSKDKGSTMGSTKPESKSGSQMGASLSNT